ncbi:hypothetical protein Nepgr_016749 [Nepenthes gracilis]|uniref:Uncharacterized protein n=1 Tax=Nepenthes gracilis TaxID=150966 RepID=A0AAD3XRW1_NEPGR|nr:hypothetical protein Nepgr_016749 [Nepenthes gracilis]
MEQPKVRRRRRTMRTQYLCLPLPVKINALAAAAATATVSSPTPSAAATVTFTATPANSRPPPASLLERFREAVFRIIMLQTALSKNVNHHPRAGWSSPDDHHHMRRSYNYQLHDPLHIEAMADCIEFIKKSSSSDDYHRNRSSTASAGSLDPAAEVALPVSAM